MKSKTGGIHLVIRNGSIGPSNNSSLSIASIRLKEPVVRGCLRLVSLKRRIKSLCRAVKNITFISIPDAFISWSIVGIEVQSKTGFRASMPTANFSTNGKQFSFISQINFGNKIAGKLSMQIKPISSKILRAVVFPDPECPLTTTTRTFRPFDQA